MREEIKVPSPGESVTELEIASLEFENGDFVEKDQIVMTVDSDKATLEIPAPISGTLEFVQGLEEGDSINVNDVVAYITEKGSEVIQEEAIETQKEDITENLQDSNSSEQIVDEDKVTISKEFNSDIEVKKVSRMQLSMATRFLDSKQKQAALTTFNEVDMTEIIATRNKYKERFLKKYDVKLGFMSFFTRACVIAIEEFPIINSQINLEKREHTFFKEINIGIAVSTDKGLLVPNIFNAEKLKLAEIEKMIVDVANKVRSGNHEISDLQNGTFTVTNGGIFGSLLSTPMLNYPQSAILGMHNIVEKVVPINGEMVIRPMMNLALTYDHCVINGKDSVSFLKRVKELLENPVELLW